MQSCALSGRLTAAVSPANVTTLSAASVSVRWFSGSPKFKFGQKNKTPEADQGASQQAPTPNPTPNTSTSSPKFNVKADPDEYDAPLSSNQFDAPRYIRSSSVTGGWSDRWQPWRAEKDAKTRPNGVGYEVPYKFRVIENSTIDGNVSKQLRKDPTNRNSSNQLEYTDFVGNRFPTLETAENYRYWEDKGIDRLLPRIFPLKLPTHRKLNPLLREYIHFLHSLDPQRFTMAKIGERYGLNESTVQKVVSEFEKFMWTKHSKIFPVGYRRIPREERVLLEKERMYGKFMGWDEMGDEEIHNEKDGSEFGGFRTTQDWMHHQTVEVESMTAFAPPAIRDPTPKRVDVDVTVKQTRRTKIMNWIDPNEKVVI